MTDVIRYVVTHIGRDGMRTLAMPQQGRFTYASAAEAQAWIDAAMEAQSIETMRALYGLPLEVRACPCWPGHFDPKQIYFDDPASAYQIIGGVAQWRTL